MNDSDALPIWGRAGKGRRCIDVVREMLGVAGRFMSRNPKKLADRPGMADARATDILGDLLASLRMTTLVYGRIELGAPWGLRFPELPDAASLYLLVRGSAVLELVSGEVTLLSAGDVALLPDGGSHTLRDQRGSPLHELSVDSCRGAPSGKPVHVGGQGAQTSLVAGTFRYGSGRRFPLFQTLPPVIHISASDPNASPWLSSTVQLLIAESAARSPGGTVVVSRLVDVLFVQALRTFILGNDCKESGLRALGDPQLGRALQLVHERPTEAWTVEGLARAVGLSRSAFAERFSGLVGQPPLEYIARWRMTKAAELLRESDLPLGTVAARAGYQSEAAFSRAFKRHEGTPPATYRRQRVRESARTVRRGDGLGSS
jgi:AraC-like DNA-binding protein